MWEPFVGKRSDPEKNRVGAEAVRAYAEAIGDPNPAYVGQGAADGGAIAPPTFPVTFGYGKIEGLKLPAGGLIHGGESFDYERPLRVDEEVYCHTVFEKFFEREGKAGTMSFLVFKRLGEDAEGGRIFTATETFIVTEAVRKRMEEGSEEDGELSRWPGA